MTNKRMTLQEKMEIFKGIYHLHMNSTKISKKLNRSVCSITREVEKGQDGSEYNPFYSEYLHLKQCNRDFLDGEDDFRKFDQRHMSKIARLLNERPRKTLNWDTPKAVFENLR